LNLYRKFSQTPVDRSIGAVDRRPAGTAWTLAAAACPGLVRGRNCRERGQLVEVVLRLT
jgi:hypothetical protein